jgi:DNA-directed RNA polymerase subunit RPC12/RpoP
MSPNARSARRYFCERCNKEVAVRESAFASSWFAAIVRAFVGGHWPFSPSPRKSYWCAVCGGPVDV